MKLASIIFRSIYILGAVVTGFLVIAVLRAAILHDPLVLQPCRSEDHDYASDSFGISKRLSEALQIKTVSHATHNYERKALSEYASYISKTFPQVHTSHLVSREVVHNFSLLYHVQGSNRNLKPYLLAAHMDVVPVEESKWSIDPFGGIIKNGIIWGRGTMDCKHLVMGILEALEFLLKNGYQPQRSFYLAFGHDEEVEGLDGAQHISKLLQSRNVKLEYLLDEGGLVVDKLMRGINVPVALVGISEKGNLHLQLTVNQTPGHSSMPPKETAIVILSKALSKLEGDVFPSMFGKGPEKVMLEEMAYSAVFPLKVVLANLWLFKPLVIRFMSSPEMSAFHRTTTAVTMVNGGIKSNMLPSSASATVNFRIHPAQTIDEVLEYVKSIINDDRIEMSVLSSFRPHPVSPIDSFGYLTIKNSIKQIYKDSAVVPSTLVANTDTKWYLGLTDSIYRFSLVHIVPNDLKRVHGHDERIFVKNYLELVNFFVHLIKNSDKSAKPQQVHGEL